MKTHDKYTRLGGPPEDQSRSELQRDANQILDEVSETVSELQQRLQPRALATDARERLRSAARAKVQHGRERAVAAGSALWQTVRRNRGIVLSAAACLVVPVVAVALIRAVQRRRHTPTAQLRRAARTVRRDPRFERGAAAIAALVGASTMSRAARPC